MKYTINTEFDGKERQLTVLNENEKDFKVYWDAQYLGTIRPEIDPDLGLIWKTYDDQLIKCCQEIGECIERVDL